MFVTSRGELSEFKRRYRWIRLFVVLSFLVLIGRLVQLQIVDGDKNSTQSLNNVIRTVSIPAVRGRIFDNKGRVAATSVPSHNIVVIPHYFDMDKGFQRLVELLQVDEGQAAKMRQKVAERLANPKDIRRFQQVTIAEGITQNQLLAVKAYQEDLPGVDIVDTPMRYYPYGAMAAHVIGYTNEVSAEDIERLADTVEDPYRPADRIGRNGVERLLESDLRGIRGWRKKVVDARGLPLPRAASEKLLPEPRMQEPRPGHDVVLTIDMALQKIVEQSLRGYPAGAVVVMEVDTGRILAAVSKPSYDINMITSGLSREDYQALNENPFKPQIDKTIYENYYPGSIFKPFTAIAALEEGRITPEDVVHCSGFHEIGKRTFRCPKPHGDITLREALVKSCNVFFFNLAELTGMDTIAKYATEFGLGARTGVGYNSEAKGMIPTKAWFNQHFPGQFRIGHTLNMAIGQGNTKVTPIQMAMAYAALANGGTVYRPQVIRRIETSDGDLVKDFFPEVIRRTVVSQANLDLIMDGLIGVVEEEDGTAYNARSNEVRVAGKTGTAQVARQRPKPGDDVTKYYYLNRDHAWFAAVAPADAPKIAIITLIEHGGGGGEHAAPVGVEIARRYFQEIAPKEEAPLVAEAVPDAPKKPPVSVDDDEKTAASAHPR
jgi:penicillin-binding protein 2